MTTFGEFILWAEDAPYNKINWAKAQEKYGSEFDVEGAMYKIGAGDYTSTGKSVQKRYEKIINDERKSLKELSVIDTRIAPDKVPMGNYGIDIEKVAYRKLAKEFGIDNLKIDQSLGRGAKIKATAFGGSLVSGMTAGALKTTDLKKYQAEYPIYAMGGELAGAVLPIGVLSKTAKAVDGGAKLGSAALRGGMAGAGYGAVKGVLDEDVELSATNVIKELLMWAGLEVTGAIVLRGVQKYLKYRKLKPQKAAFEKALDDVIENEVKSSEKIRVQVGKMFKGQRKMLPPTEYEYGKDFIMKKAGKTKTAKIAISKKQKKKYIQAPYIKKSAIQFRPPEKYHSGLDVTAMIHDSKMYKAVANYAKTNNITQFARKIVSESGSMLKSKTAKKAGAEIADVRADTYTIGGKYTTDFRNANAKLLKDPVVNDLAYQQLSGKVVSPKSNPAKVGIKIASKIRTILDDIAREAEKVGVQVLDKGVYRPFRAIKDYVPRILKNDVRDKIYDNMETVINKAGGMNKSDNELIRVFNELKANNNIHGLSKKANEAIDYIVKKQGVSYGDAMLKVRRFVNDAKFNPFGNIEKARTLDLPSSFYETELGKIIPEYIRGSSRAIAEVKMWGAQRQGMLKTIKELGAINLDEKEIVENLYQITSGLYGKMHPMNPLVKKAVDAFINYEVLTKIGLGTATIPNITQTLISTTVKGGMYRTLVGGVKYLTNKSYRDSVRSSGATLAEAIQMLTGEEAKGFGARLTSKVLTPFSLINRANKALAASTAKEAIKAWSKQAQGSGRRAFKARRQLESLGIDYKTKLTDKSLQKGMFRFASDTQLQRDAMKEPIWMNSNFRVLALFKRFGYRQFNFIRKEVYNEVVKHGNTMPLVRLAAGGALGGVFVSESKDLLKRLISGESYQKKDLPLLQRIVNIYASVGALGWASDVVKLYEEKGNMMAGELVENIMQNITPLLTGEMTTLGKGAISIAKSKKPVDQLIKELQRQTPLTKMMIKRRKKSSTSTFGG